MILHFCSFPSISYLSFYLLPRSFSYPRFTVFRSLSNDVLPLPYELLLLYHRPPLYRLNPATPVYDLITTKLFHIKPLYHVRLFFAFRQYQPDLMLHHIMAIDHFCSPNHPGIRYWCSIILLFTVTWYICLVFSRPGNSSLFYVFPYVNLISHSWDRNIRQFWRQEKCCPTLEGETSTSRK